MNWTETLFRIRIIIGATIMGIALVSIPIFLVGYSMQKEHKRKMFLISSAIIAALVVSIALIS